MVTSPDTAPAIVDALLKAHVNFIKVQNGMTSAIYDAIAEEARAIGLPFEGHLPEARPLAAAAAGRRTLEHGQHMMLCSEADWQKIRTEQRIGRLMKRHGAQPSTCWRRCFRPSVALESG